MYFETSMKKIVAILIIISSISCNNSRIEYDNIDTLVEAIKKQNNLDGYPTLVIDGFDYNYSLLKGKIAIDKKDIGFFEFTQTNKNDNGALRVVTPLLKIKTTDFKDYHVELNNKKINYDAFKKIQIQQITKKVLISDKKINDSLYNGAIFSLKIYTQ